MIEWVQSYAEVDDEGEPTGLVRVLKRDGGIYGEVYVDGDWVDSPPVTRLVMDPLYAVPVEEDEIPGLIARLPDN